MKFVQADSANDHGRFLRNSLRANAVFSSVSGLAFALASGTIGRYLGNVPSWLVLGVGIQLFCFAGLLLWLSGRSEISSRLVWGIVAADLLWVIGTAIAIFLEFLTPHGAYAALGIADVVLVLAILQAVGVYRMGSSERANRISLESS